MEEKLKTTERRILVNNKVISMILRGKSKAEILNFISKEMERLDGKTTAKHAENIYYHCRNEIKDEIDGNKNYYKSDLLSKLYYLYSKSMDTDDIRTALNILNSITKLTGVAEAEKIDMNVTGNIEINFDL